VKQRLGDELYAELVDSNLDDLTLFNRACELAQPEPLRASA
jgi:hypothetical protein